MVLNSDNNGLVYNEIWFNLAQVCGLMQESALVLGEVAVSSWCMSLIRAAVAVPVGVTGPVGEVTTHRWSGVWAEGGIGTTKTVPGEV